MHGCRSGSSLLVNAEVHSMGGIVDGGDGIGTKTSPKRAAIEKAQAELRQEYDVREERRRELEFLEKGGNPLDFKVGHTDSVSVQSTSLIDQHPEQLVTSEAKGSFALTASPRGDSVESSGRPGAHPVCEPNSADNLMLFDGENEFPECERNSIHPIRSNIAPSEQSSELDSNQKAKESGDFADFGLPRKAYRRRNRYRSHHDGARSSSAEVVPSCSGAGSSAPSRRSPREAKMLIPDTDNQKVLNVSSNCNLKPTSPNGSIVLKTIPPDGPVDMEVDDLQDLELKTAQIKGGMCDDVSEANASKELQDDENNRLSQLEDQGVPTNLDSGGRASVGGREGTVSTGFGCPPSVSVENIVNQAVFGQMNGFVGDKGETKGILTKQNVSVMLSTKGLDSECSCTQTSPSADGNNDTEMCNNLKNIDSNLDANQQVVGCERTTLMGGDELVKEKTEYKINDNSVAPKDERHPVSQSQAGDSSLLKAKEEINGVGSRLPGGVEDPSASEGEGLDAPTVIEMEYASTGMLQGPVDSSIRDHQEAMPSVKDSAVTPHWEPSSGISLKLSNKEKEDSILEEARIIEAKHKRIAELSIGILPVESHRRSQWDFVLEEMAWLANDFAQERLWKMTATAQIGRLAVFASQIRFKEQNSLRKQKNVAQTLANAVIEFWHSAQDRSKEQEQCDEKASRFSIQGYAVRFLNYNSYHVPDVEAEAPVTPDRISDCGVLDFLWEEHLTEENLFYTVPPGAMEMYRKSIESHLMHFEKISSSMQEEVETSGYDAVAELGSQDNYEEDEGETSAYCLPGLEGSKSSKSTCKKRKHLMESYSARQYEGVTDMQFMQCMENKVGIEQSVLMGKRRTNTLRVSIPTKRVRTASRQRVIGPFSFGNSMCTLAPNKADASSGDTNSFQDDQSTLLGGSQIPNILEVESVGEFEKQLPFDTTEVTKPKKKKKAKHLGSTYEQRWQLDSNFQTHQKDPSKKRMESHQLESNGSSGLFGQHIAKKPKMMRQSLVNSLDCLNPIPGSIPSPAASQMSNMSNPNKFIKMLSGRDRGRKAKVLKVPAGQPGSGSPWSLFEDQALIVLVHDMGPNWELISDAINNTLQFKSIFRKSKECKERHKILMDGSAGDGADSAEDSGSSQRYPSTLPGIPKGSARQLFQRLQGPMEEDTLKSHFEKIIMIGQKQKYRPVQNDNQDPKQFQQPHSSHTHALSQVCPNNLNGGPVLTPVDLCDATASSPDVISVGYQGLHTGGLPISSQNAVPPMLPASSANTTTQGSSNIGNNFVSPTGPLNAISRDGRYGVPRTAPLSLDEQQRMQQYNQILSGRSIQQHSLTVSGSLPGTNHGVNMLLGGGAMGINRNMPMARPGFQGIASPSMLNSGSMLSSGMVPMPSPVNMHSGTSSGRGNSMTIPRDALQMMRPGQNPENQKHMMVPELQMQVSQGSSQGVPPFSRLSSSFSSQPSPPPAQPLPLTHQAHPTSPQQPHALNNSHHPELSGANHATNTQHQAYAMRIAKERQLQQRLLQQQHQFAASNPLMPRVQAQTQLPMSAPLQSSSKIQSQTSPSSVTPSPLTSSSSMNATSQQQNKQHMRPHGLGRNPQTGSNIVANQMGKQRQLQLQQQQHFQPGGRNHPQSRQLSHSQQQAKLLKGVGRGNLMQHQNLPVDPSRLNGLSTTPGSQSTEKGENVMHLMHGQGSYSGAGVNSVQPLKHLVPAHSSNQSQPQQKNYSSQATPSSEQLHQMPAHSNNNTSGHVPLVASSPSVSGTHHTVAPLVKSTSNHQHLQSQPEQHIHANHKLANHTPPTVQRVFHQNFQVNSDPPSKLQVGEAPAEQCLSNNSNQMAAIAMPQASIDANKTQPVASSAVAPQWTALEPLYESGMCSSALQSGSTATPPLANSPMNEFIPPGSQSLPTHGHDLGAPWQRQQQEQHQSSLIPPLSSTPPLPKQQQQSSQKHLPPEKQPQMQTQLLQAANSSLYGRPTNSRLE